MIIDDLYTILPKMPLMRLAKRWRRDVDEVLEIVTSTEGYKIFVNGVGLDINRSIVVVPLKDNFDRDPIKYFDNSEGLIYGKYRSLWTNGFVLKKRGLDFSEPFVIDIKDPLIQLKEYSLVKENSLKGINAWATEVRGQYAFFAEVRTKTNFIRFNGLDDDYLEQNEYRFGRYIYFGIDDLYIDSAHIEFVEKKGADKTETQSLMSNIDISDLYPSIYKAQGDYKTFVVPILKEFIKLNSDRPTPKQLWQLMISNKTIQNNFYINDEYIEGFGKATKGLHLKNLSDSLSNWRKEI